MVDGSAGAGSADLSAQSGCQDETRVQAEMAEFRFPPLVTKSRLKGLREQGWEL